jgi:hypothetical protein
MMTLSTRVLTPTEVCYLNTPVTLGLLSLFHEQASMPLETGLESLIRES